ncbi:hypothetical protein BDK51DRAFT_31433, partial [Blyttiomyces helicus]
MWVPEGAAQPDISIPYETVKAQLVNVAGSGKVLIKVTLWEQPPHPEANHTFTFTASSALQDREQVKNVLGEQLATATRPLTAPTVVNSTAGGKRPVAKRAAEVVAPAAAGLTAANIQARRSLLSSRKDLADLHRELVIAGFVSEEEFWATRQ